MVRKGLSKRERQKSLEEKIRKDPFLTDEELSEYFDVSIQTIRLDRMELGIPELRERMRSVAEGTYTRVRSLAGKEIIGELVDLDLGKKGISILEADASMAFEKTNVVRGQFIYAQAESLAIAVIDADVALIGVANIKYKQPVTAGQKLVAQAEVVRQRGNKYFVWVKIKLRMQEVFRGKFILVAMDEWEKEE
ncbi:MAG: Transcription factor FapR [Firmicutes bacterium]|nr:Transcription factor FapR [Bacillota bacterium]MDI6704630.1 transcription factor FapR [Bacillota bacterium]